MLILVRANYETRILFALALILPSSTPCYPLSLPNISLALQPSPYFLIFPLPPFLAKAVEILVPLAKPPMTTWPPSAWICTFNQISLLKLCGAPIALKPTTGHMTPQMDPDIPKIWPKWPKHRSPLSPVGPQQPTGHLTAPSSPRRSGFEFKWPWNLRRRCTGP